MGTVGSRPKGMHGEWRMAMCVCPLPVCGEEGSRRSRYTMFLHCISACAACVLRAECIVCGAWCLVLALVLVLGARCQVRGSKKKRRGDKRVLPCVALPHVGHVGQGGPWVGKQARVPVALYCTSRQVPYQKVPRYVLCHPCSLLSPIVHGPYAPVSGRALWDIPGRMNAVAKPGHMFLRATLGTTNKPQESGRRDVERRDTLERGEERRARLSDSVPPQKEATGVVPQLCDHP